MNLHRTFLAAFAALALSAGSAAAAQEPSRFSQLIQLSKEIQNGTGCPAGTDQRATALIIRLEPNEDKSLLYFGVNRVADELMFKGCLDQAETLFAMVSTTPQISDYDRDTAKTGLAQVLARRR